MRTALDNADAWADREDEAGADLLDLKLDELKGEISPVLERYGVSAEEGGEGGGGGPDDDLGEFGDHDELWRAEPRAGGARRTVDRDTAAGCSYSEYSR